jgi:uncharacterized protein YkwD
MKWRRVISLLLLAAVLAPPGRGGDAGGPAARRIDPLDFDPALLAKEILRASNAARAQNGVRVLKPRRELDAAADDQAAMMALMLFSGHGNPLRDQRDPYSRVERRGLRPQEVGENAASVPLRDPATGRARTYAGQADAVVAAWMNSPGHRANLLKRSFRNLGCAARIALVPIGQPMVFATQVFCTPE